MNKFICGSIAIEKSIQIATLVGLLLFLGYLGFVNIEREGTNSVRGTSPTTQQSNF